MALLASEPGKHHIKVFRGMNLSVPSVWRDTLGALIDFSGYTARMMIRPTKDSDTVLVSLTQADGITLGGAAGTIVIARTAAQTAAYTFNRGEYDLEVIDGAGLVTRLLEGDVTVSAEATR